MGVSRMDGEAGKREGQGRRGRLLRGVAGLAGLVATQRLLGNEALERGDAYLRRAEGGPAADQPPQAPSFLRRNRVGRVFARPYLVIHRAVDHFILDDALSMASMIAFTVILALFPFLIFMTAFAALWGGEDLAMVISESLFDALPPDIAEALEPEVQSVLDARSGGSLLTFGLAIMLFSLTGAVEAVRAGLTRAYGAIETRSVLRTRFASLLFVLAGSVALFLVTLLAVVAPVAFRLLAPFIPDILPYRDTFHLVRLVVLAVVLSALVFAMHRWLPPPSHRFGRFHDLWVGVLSTLALWYVLGRGFSIYLSYFGGYGSTYAGLAGIVAALIFFYLASAVLLFGGEINRALRDLRRSGWPGLR